MPAQSLVTASQCLECIPEGRQLSVLIYLFATIAGVPIDAQTLVNASTCLECVPVGKQMDVLISLAEEILAGSGGGVSDAVTCGVGFPVTAPASGCGMYIDTATDAVYIYRLGAWSLKV